jgi:hypothetical protein
MPAKSTGSAYGHPPRARSRSAVAALRPRARQRRLERRAGGEPAARARADAVHAESGYDAIRGLAVTAARRLAWIGVRVSGGVVGAAEVRRRRPDFSDRSVVLDSGSGIDPRSLRRVGSMLRWRHDGVARSAAM